MALDLTEIIKNVIPNIGCELDIDSGLYIVGVKEFNSDEILTAIEALTATVETPFTGAGNVVVGTERIAPGAAFELTEIELHLSAAPTTGVQNLVITKGDGVDAAYDAVILTLDLVANAVTDLRIKPGITCKATDVITAAWTNTDGRTYGLIFKHKLV